VLNAKYERFSTAVQPRWLHQPCDELDHARPELSDGSRNYRPFRTDNVAQRGHVALSCPFWEIPCPSYKQKLSPAPCQRQFAADLLDVFSPSAVSGPTPQ